MTMIRTVFRKGFSRAYRMADFQAEYRSAYDNVADLQKDKLVCWQDRHVQWIAGLVSFASPQSSAFCGMDGRSAGGF
jgi:hypothetical protein